LKDIRKVKDIMKGGRYDIVILDEIINCVDCRFIEEKAVLDLVRAKPASLELILTGRGATRRLVDMADYVTRLDNVKHPYDRGLPARRGIEY
jgi:cob(I)alamin adenosyltransferase